MHTIFDNYKSGCPTCDGQFTLSRKVSIKLSKQLNTDEVVNDAINQLYDDKKINKATKTALFKTHNAPLQKAVIEGYSPNIKIEYGTPNYEFLKQLQINTAVFSIFKSHASMVDMASMLKDKDGNVRTKEAFKTEALKVDNTYRTTYLESEYDTAVRTARMASQWGKYEKNKHLYPYLKYLLTKASKPDEKHLAFVGIVRKIDDDFWSYHYPPNRWRCQCGVEQVDEGETDVPDNLPAIPAEFRFNSGKTGQIFDFKKSEFIKSASAKDQPALIKQATTFINNDAAKNAPYQPVHETNDGKLIEAHPLAFKNSDFKEVVAEAKVLAKAGFNIKVVPEVTDTELRKTLTPKGAKGTKNPDFIIDDKFVADLKTPEKSTKKAIDESFSRCFKQCDNIVLKITDNITFTSEELFRIVKGKLSHSDYAMFDNIIIDFKGKIYATNRHKIVQLDEWPIKRQKD